MPIAFVHFFRIFNYYVIRYIEILFIKYVLNPLSSQRAINEIKTNKAVLTPILIC